MIWNTTSSKRPPPNSRVKVHRIFIPFSKLIQHSWSTSKYTSALPPSKRIVQIFHFTKIPVECLESYAQHINSKRENNKLYEIKIKLASPVYHLLPFRRHFSLALYSCADAGMSSFCAAIDKLLFCHQIKILATVFLPSISFASAVQTII